MATAEELFSASGIDEPHIIINSDRSITVPTELKNVAVQNDHNIETVVFDCPRYWDDFDMSTMKVSINYALSNSYEDTYVCPKVTIDETDQDIMHFSWTISNKVTHVSGEVTFLVCLMLLDSDGTAIKKWHSQICKDMRVSDGMDCDTTAISEYEEAKKAEWSEFWDDYQDNGNRSDYNSAFYGYGWTNKTFKPKYDIISLKSHSFFSDTKIEGSLKEILEKQGVILDVSKTANLTNAFKNSLFTELPDLFLSSLTIYSSTFDSMSNLETVKIISVAGFNSTSNTFRNCVSLKNLELVGPIRSKILNVQWSPLTHDSLINILNNLVDKSADTSDSWKVTIGPDNIAKLTSDELKIAEDKGWMIV